MSDEDWEKSIRVLASCVRFPGQLIITEHDSRDRVILGDYIIHRGTVEYASILEPLGFNRTDVIPYSSHSNPNCFHVYSGR